MPRQLRIEYPGAIYHVMNRGDRRELIFKSDANHELFLQPLGEACPKPNWQVQSEMIESLSENVGQASSLTVRAASLPPVHPRSMTTAKSEHGAGKPREPSGKDA